MRRHRMVGAQARRRHWEKHVRDWRSSGLSQIEYCRVQGISDKSFGYWKRKLRVADVAITLVEVPAPGPSIAVFPRFHPLRLHITDTYWVEIEKDFDPQSLNRLLDVLEGR